MNFHEEGLRQPGECSLNKNMCERILLHIKVG